MQLWTFSRIFIVLITCAALSCCTRDPAAEFARAKALADKGDVAGAIIQLKSTLQLAPNDGAMRLMLGRLYNQKFDGAAAEKELRLAREYGISEGGRVGVELARALRAQGKYEELVRKVEPDPSYEPAQLASVYALRGRAQHALSLDQDSRDSLTKAVAIEPTNLDVGLLSAQNKAGDGDTTGALQTIDALVKRQPNFYDGWLVKAELLNYLGRDDAALAAYGEVLKINPTDYRSLLSRPTFFLRQGKLADAQKDVDLLLRTYPGHPLGLVQKGLLGLAQGNPKDALESAQLALKAVPNLQVANTIAGVASYHLKLFATAENFLSSSFAQNPNDVLTRRVYAQTLLQIGQTKRALEVIGPLVSADSKDPRDFIVAGDAYLQLGESDQALAAFDRAAALDPKDATAKIKGGLLQIGTGEVALGLDQLETGVMLVKAPSQADEMLILALLKRKEVGRATATLEKLEKLNPQNSVLGNLRGVVLMAQSKREEAVKVFEAVLAHDPTFFPAAENLARIDILAGKPDAARQRYLALLTVDPKNLAAMLSIADLEEKLGRRTEETAMLERAAAAAPKRLEPRARLIPIYLSMGDKVRALSAADEALAVNPNSPQVILLATQTQFATGVTNRAVNTMQNLIRLAPKVGNGYRLLAEFQAAAGQPAEAEQTLRKIIEIDPHYPPAKIALVALLREQKKSAEATEFATQLQRSQPKSPLGFILHGEILEGDKKYHDAASAYVAALQRQDVGEIAVKAFQAEVQAGDADGAFERLTQWADAHPADPVARSKIGDMLLAKGDYRGAVTHYEQAVKTPNIPLEVRNKLAWVYYKLNDPRALATAEAVVKDGPTYALAVDTLGWIMVEQGDVKGGLPILQRAQALAAANSDISYHVAAALARSGERDAARAALTNLLADKTENQSFESKAEATKLLASLK